MTYDDITNVQCLLFFHPCLCCCLWGGGGGGGSYIYYVLPILKIFLCCLVNFQYLAFPTKDCLSYIFSWLLFSYVVMTIREVRRLFGIDIEVRGTEHLNGEEPSVVVANHQTSLDFFGDYYCVCVWIVILLHCSECATVCCSVLWLSQYLGLWPHWHFEWQINAELVLRMSVVMLSQTKSLFDLI